MAPPSSRRSRRRAALDLAGGQLGDLDIKTVAGENVYNGIDGPTLLRLLEGQADERELVAKAIERVADQQRAHEIMQERRDRVDAEEREKRRELLDTALAELRELAAVQGRWLAWLTIAAIIVAAIVVAVLVWLVVRELTLPVDLAALIRLWLGASLAVLAQLRRPL